MARIGWLAVDHLEWMTHGQWLANSDSQSATRNQRLAVSKSQSANRSQRLAVSKSQSAMAVTGVHLILIILITIIYFHNMIKNLVYISFFYQLSRRIPAAETIAAERTVEQANTGCWDDRCGTIIAVLKWGLQDGKLVLQLELRTS